MVPVAFLRAAAASSVLLLVPLAVILVVRNERLVKGFQQQQQQQRPSTVVVVQKKIREVNDDQEEEDDDDDHSNLSSSPTTIGFGRSSSLHQRHARLQQIKASIAASIDDLFNTTLLVELFRSGTTTAYNDDDEFLLEVLGIAPVAWPFKTSTDWCPLAEPNWQFHGAQRQPALDGLMFAKIPKCASSMGSSVTLRIATTVGQATYNKNHSSLLCRNRVLHGNVLKQGFWNRTKARSLAWSLVRNPTRRVISEYFHFAVSRKNANASDVARFQRYCRHRGNQRGYMLRYLTHKTTYAQKPVHVVNHDLLRSGLYDFIGLAERMDESIVVLQLLLGLNTSNVVTFLNPKVGDGTSMDATCHVIRKSFVAPEMADFFNSDYWLHMTFWDSILHKAVNASLTKTIDETIGRARFERALQDYQALKQRVATACQGRVRLRCNKETGKLQKNDCLLLDLGCGFDCIDELLLKEGSLRGDSND